MKAVIYLRVSTLRQSRDGLSLSTQRELCRKYCDGRGWPVIKIFRDGGVSAYRRGQSLPNLTRAINLASKRKATLVVYSLSRFGRSLIDSVSRLQQLTDAGAMLASYSEGFDLNTTSGRLMLKVILAFAEAESETIGDRVRAVNDDTVARLGYRTQGAQPAGWKIVNGVRVPCEREIALVARVNELAGAMGVAGAVGALEAAGEPTIHQLRGKAGASGWTKRKVRHLLVKKAPAGSAPHG